MKMSDSDSEDEPKPCIAKSSSDSSSEEEEVRPEPSQKEKDDETFIKNGETKETKMSVQQMQPLPRRKRFTPNYDVDGVYKLVVGEETQLQVEIVIGNHVNAQYPWKFVKKSNIMESIEIGGELSEFYPLRRLLEVYDDDLILMGYIVDESKDTDEFNICCTKKARDHCKQQSDRFIKRQEKKLEKAVLKKPKPWVSFGSEKEILEMIPVNSRTLMEMEIKAKFPTEYEPETYNVRDTHSVRDGFLELTPYRQKFNNVFRRRVDCATQVAPPRVENYAQTVLKYPKNMWTQSIADALGKLEDNDGRATTIAEGEDGSSTDEDTAKPEPPDEVGLASYKAAFKRLRRPSYLNMINNFVSNKQKELNSIIELNTVMDIYCNDYPNLIGQKIIDTYATMSFEEYVCFTDVRAKDKYVSSAVFHPMWSGIVAISYADGSPNVMKSLGPRPDPIQRAVYGLNPVMIWSHLDSLIPKLYLESPREVKSLSFCPFNENILVGGLINGQIIIWDLSNKLENVEKLEVLSEKREKYRIAMNANMGWMKSVQDSAVVSETALSNLMHSHYGPVTAIGWLSPNIIITSQGKTIEAPEDKKSLQLITGSEDGNILIWNLSVDSASTLVETHKIKKSKRVPRRPSGLLVDVSPYKILDRVLQPCYKIILGLAGEPQTFTLQSFGMTPPSIKYDYTPRKARTGRKYFKCEIVSQDEEKMNKILYCSSKHGEMRRITWEGHEFNTGEVVNSEYCDIKYSCCIHDGIISCTQNNPHLNSLTLTVGGKIFAIWSDDLENRPLMWKKRPYRLTDGAWSLYKPSLFFISTAEGGLEVWDILLKSDHPISIQTLSGIMLTGVSLHSLPLTKNIIGVSDANGSFKTFLNPPIFMLENESYMTRMDIMIKREIRVMKSFITWQDTLMRDNPEILLEIKRKEGALLAGKEEEKRKEREELEKRLEEEAEARRQARLRVVGPEERWQKVIQKLIERTIAVKKRINRAELIEQEKPLRELEAQRLEKEKRMLDIMKNEKQIFADTVAILFPEAVKKPEPLKQNLISDDKEGLKSDYLRAYEQFKITAFKTVKDNPYQVSFSWDSTLAEGKERRQALNAQNDYIYMHKKRLEEEGRESTVAIPPENLSRKLSSRKSAIHQDLAKTNMSDIMAHRALEGDDDDSVDGNM